MTGSISSTSGTRAGARRRGWLVPAALCLAATARAGDTLDALMQQLARTPHGRVTYTEKQYLSVLEKPVESSGELLYEPPDSLEKRTLKPRPLSLSARGDVLTVQRGRRQHVVELKDYPQAAPFIDSIRATLAGDRARLERYFSVTLSGDLDDWTLELTPLRPAEAGGVRSIRIRGHGGELARVDIAQADGDRSELSIGPPP